MTFYKLIHIEGHSSQIHQIPVKSKIVKSLKFSPFDSLTENRKSPKVQPHSPSGSVFMVVLEFFLPDLTTKCDLEHFQGTLKNSEY